MKFHTKRNREILEQLSIDLAQIQLPLLEKSTGPLQLVLYLQSGTPEVKQILLQECLLVFECKVCRSLFRGIANLLSHKRIYCTESSCNKKTVNINPVEETLIVHPEPPNWVIGHENLIQEGAEVDLKAMSIGVSSPPKISKLKDVKQASKVADSEKTRAAQKLDFESSKCAESCKKSKVVAQVVNGAKNWTSDSRVKERLRKQANPCRSVLKLSFKKETCKAAFQKNVSEKPSEIDSKDKKSKAKGAGENIDDTFERVSTTARLSNEQCLLASRKINEREKRKVKPTKYYREFLPEPLWQRTEERSTFNCADCDITFTLKKSLLRHRVEKHSKTRRLYPCISCLKKFYSMSSALRHIRMKHKHVRNYDKARSRIERNAFEVDKSNKEEAADPSVDGEVTISPILFKTTASKPETVKQEQLTKEKESKDVCITDQNLTCTCGRTFCQPQGLAMHRLVCQSKDILPRLSGHFDEAILRDAEISWMMRLSRADTKSICSLISRKELKCLKCKKVFGHISNLHRHVLRHLGWKRFKCCLCQFTSYNRSECRTHLFKVHKDKVISDANDYMVDLEYQVSNIPIPNPFKVNFLNEPASSMEELHDSMKVEESSQSGSEEPNALSNALKKIYSLKECSELKQESPVRALPPLISFKHLQKSSRSRSISEHMVPPPLTPGYPQLQNEPLASSSAAAEKMFPNHCTSKLSLETNSSGLE